MNYVCGSYRITGCSEVRDYGDLNEYVTRSGLEGILLGEDASDFMSFHVVEVNQPFSGRTLRIGMILDNNRGRPILCPIHRSSTLAIGINKCVQIINLSDESIVVRLELDSHVHHILCNDKVLVAVHELGASVIQLSTWQEIANPFCEVVADARLSESALVLVSTDEESTHVDLTAYRE